MFDEYVDPHEYAYYDERKNRIYKVKRCNEYKIAQETWKTYCLDLDKLQEQKRKEGNSNPHWAPLRDSKAREDKQKAIVDLALLAQRRGWVSTVMYELENGKGKRK